MWRRATYAIVGLSVTACAAATSAERPLIRSAGRDVITAAEIVAARVTDVYQAVSHLRPEFLRRRTMRPPTPLAPPPILVYLDDLPFGSTPESLKDIPLERVRMIRYLGPTDADLRFGASHPGGAILVTTRKK
jgi:hypothetical protein